MTKVKQETKLKVENDVDTPFDVLASEIRAISEGVQKMQRGRLEDKAILILVSHASGYSQAVVKGVIDGMASLERIYLK